MRESTLDTFWERVNVASDSQSCWLWTGTLTYNGYGKFYFKGRTWRAHRFAYANCVVAIPSGVYVCHTCDVRACVRPSHLFLGTAADNIRDGSAKGRMAKAVGGRHGSRTHPNRVPRGERHHHSILTTEKVLEILQYMEATPRPTQKELAKQYGVSETAINQILKGTRWKHVSRLTHITA